MSKNDSGKLTKFITGGDLAFHRIQLLVANILRLLLVGCAVFVVTAVALIYIFVDKYEWYIFYKTMQARFWTFIHLPNFNLNFFRADGQLIEGVTSAHLLKFVQETPQAAELFNHVAWHLSVAAILSIAVVVAMIIYYVRLGHDAGSDDFLRGQKIVDAKTLAKLIKNPSPIKLAGIPIPAELLPRNNMVVGGVGTGKTVVIDQMIEDARTWGKKMVIYDKTGEFTQKFFRPGVDILLSPVDARCADWSIFADLRQITDAALVSTFFVPENKKSSDPIWDNAARMLLEDLIVIVRNKGGSMADVKNIITQSSLEDLSALLKQHNAPSCGTINPGNAKGSESVRLTLVAQPAVRFFSFFNKTNASFSVREFVRRKDDACLFLVSSSTQHEVARPFISAWVELALAEVMSMPPTTDIRLMFFLDELASLSKLKALDIALTEGRKFGTVFTVGLQNLSQADEIFGENMTKVYVANLQNKLFLRTEEESSAKRLADTLGKEEVKEFEQSLSFGVQSDRDGSNLNGKRVEPNLVTATEIMVLPDLTGWIKIAGAYPIAKVEFKYKSRPANVEAYIERDGLNLAAPSPVAPLALPQNPTSDPAESAHRWTEPVAEVADDVPPAQEHDDGWV
jgi:type IV conjugative transfer system coupling protein TraD